MKRFILEESFSQIFPDASIYILLVKNIDNHSSNEQKSEDQQLLAAGKKEAQKFLTEEPFSSNPVTAEWREAFTHFKTKKGARSSIEALLKRVHQDRDFAPINPLVDCYNFVSLKYGVPCGGEDLNKISGDIRLGTAVGGESFLPLGADTDAPALPGEIIYADQEGVICRCFNWREAQRTMLAEETTEAVFFIEALNAEQKERSQKAQLKLQQLLQQKLQADVRTAVVRSSAPILTLTD